jgi:transcription termination factor NusB
MLNLKETYLCGKKYNMSPSFIKRLGVSENELNALILTCYQSNAYIPHLEFRYIEELRGKLDNQERKSNKDKLIRKILIHNDDIYIEDIVDKYISTCNFKQLTAIGELIILTRYGENDKLPRVPEERSGNET